MRKQTLLVHWITVTKMKENERWEKKSAERKTTTGGRGMSWKLCMEQWF